MANVDEDFKKELARVGNKLPGLVFVTALRTWRNLRIYQPALSLPQILVTSLGSVCLRWVLGEHSTQEVFLVEVLVDGGVEWSYDGWDHSRWFYMNLWDDAVPLRAVDYVKRFV